MSLSARPGNFGTRFHNFLYDRLALNFVYKAFTTTDIKAAIGGIRALGIRGCAISMPFKETSMESLDHVDTSAAGIESVNTIVNEQGVLTGYNTDYQAVRELLVKSEIPVTEVFAVRGSGGMAKAVVCALRDVGFKRGFIVARNQNTGRVLAEKYGFEWVPELTAAVKVLVNASPIGMAGGSEANDLAFSPREISEAELVFEVVAIPMETPMVKLARSLGTKRIITGFEVITLQALEQFVLYTGVRPPKALVQEAAEFARA